MKKNTLDKIISKYKQYEVDFVFPNKDKDVHVNLDLYLMYESPDTEWNEAQAIVFWYFNDLLKKYRKKEINELEIINLLHFPEVEEIGFGHCVSGVKGAGTSKKRAKLLKTTIFDNPEIQKIGMGSLAKLAIQVEGYGPDLLSDMTASFALDHLIKYTDEQVKTYNLKTMEVNLERGYDFRLKEWKPRMKVKLPYFDNGEARLLVPRHISRRMPVLSTDEFYNGFLKYILQAEEVSRIRSLSIIGKEPKVLIKDIEQRLEKEYESLSGATRSIASKRPELVKRYSNNPHEFKNRRRPRKTDVDWDKYKVELINIPSGTENATIFSDFLLKLFKAMYGDFLLRGTSEMNSYKNTYRYDVTFLNASTTSFFKVIEKTKIVDSVVLIEAKNYGDTVVANKEFTQALGYTLNDRREFIFLAKRAAVTKKDIERAQQHYLRQKVIIFPISDDDLIDMIEARKKSAENFDFVLEERLQIILNA